MLSSGSISIGRAPGNDWVLPDPERSLSKTHCTVTEEGGRFVLTDLSTNGIFLNELQQATERDSRVVLNDGDTLRLGNYTISAAAIDDRAAAFPPQDDIGLAADGLGGAGFDGAGLGLGYPGAVPGGPVAGRGLDRGGRWTSIHWTTHWGACRMRRSIIPSPLSRCSRKYLIRSIGANRAGIVR